MSSGVDFMAGMNYLYSQGFVNFNGIDSVNRIMATSFYEASFVCQESIAAGQLVKINCTDLPAISSPGLTDNCTKCQELKKTLLFERTKLEKQAVQLSSGTYVPQELSGQTKIAWDSNTTDSPYYDPCRMVCSSCLIETNEQNLFVSISQKCFSEQSVAFNTQMKTNIYDQLIRLMVDKQKQLAAVNVKDALDPTLRDNLVRNITNELYTAFSTKISSDVVASVLQYQEMSISNQSYSVSMQHNVQSITVDILVEIFSKFYQKANYYNQAEIATKTTNLMKNDDLSSLRDSLNTIITTIEDLWNSAVGKIIIVAIGVMYLIVVSLTLFFVFIKKK